jgi:phospho-2-dehydro-3-deoxyheptonate aldolase
MEVLLPNDTQAELINASRAGQAQRMEQNGTVHGPQSVAAGPCAADSNQYPDGSYATEWHITTMHTAAGEQPEVEYIARLNGTKPRTRGGTTGLLHQPGGPQIYAAMASRLTDRGIALAAEIMDESDAAVAGPWLTVKWAGTRTLEDSGVRQLLRTTEHELEAGIVPAPVWVKSAANGNLQPSINALHTIRAAKSEVRTRFVLDALGRPALKQVVTHGNTHTGVLLRGHTPRPDGPLDEILEAEIVTTREQLDADFGEGVIPIGVDLSHGHAAWEGGGEEGQLALAESLIRLMGRGVVVDLVMAETYALPGKQTDGGTVPGLSQVDKCISEPYATDLTERISNARASQQLTVAQRI